MAIGRQVSDPSERVVHLDPLPSAREHLEALTQPLLDLEQDLDRIDAWGAYLARVLLDSGRVLAVGNGGSAAQAQHLTSELVGRYRDDRPPMSAIALHAESSSFTAICNDFGAVDVFARQVRAHGREGDVLVALSTSGRSVNVVEAVRAALDVGMTCWAITGMAPNELAVVSDDAVTVRAPTTATVQEVHQVVVHLLCLAVERVVAATAAKMTHLP